MMPETFISPCCNKNTLTKDSRKKNRIADFTFCLSGGLKVVARMKKALRRQEIKGAPGQKDKNGQTAQADKIYYTRRMWLWRLCKMSGELCLQPS